MIYHLFYVNKALFSFFLLTVKELLKGAEIKILRVNYTQREGDVTTVSDTSPFLYARKV